MKYMAIRRAFAAVCMTALWIGITGNAISQQSDTASSQLSIGQQAVSFLLSKVALDPTNLVPKTKTPLSSQGNWSIGKDTPEACPKTNYPCVLVLYTVPGTDVLCKWIVLLNENSEETHLLDANEDAARYMIFKPSKTKSKSSLLSAQKPIYPDAAKAEHIQGMVKILATIDPTGRVRKVELISGPEMLRSSAEDAVKQWVYKPVTVDSIPVTVRIPVEVTYRMGSSDPLFVTH